MSVFVLTYLYTRRLFIDLAQKFWHNISSPCSYTTQVKSILRIIFFLLYGLSAFISVFRPVKGISMLSQSIYAIFGLSLFLHPFSIILNILLLLWISNLRIRYSYRNNLFTIKLLFHRYYLLRIEDKHWLLSHDSTDIA